MLQNLMARSLDVDVSRMRDRDFLARQRELEEAKRQRIETGSGWREVVACPTCGSTDSIADVHKAPVTLRCCSECGLRYGDRIPANPADVYAPEEYQSFSLADTEDHFQYRRERFGRERMRILERCCGDLSKKKLLDVGCGNGYFLSAAMEHCGQCFGTEFSARLRGFAIEKTGLQIFDRNLAELPERDFDIITLFDVIEHIADPVAFMRAVSSILRPGGHVLVFTPNFDSFSIRVMGQHSSIIDPTEHVILFTLPSLEQLGRVLGFQTVFRETQGLDVENILALSHFQGREPDLILTERGAELQAMINGSDCGDYARILYRKFP